MIKDMISIVVPIYNSQDYLENCLDSLINQTYKNIEIICVDDGSTDSSGRICDEYALKDSRIVVVHKENGGLSSARNTGNSYITGEYLMYLDSDDWIDLNTCEVALSIAKQHNADIVFWNYIREFANSSQPRYIYDKENIIFETEEQITTLQRRFFGPYEKELATPEKLDSIVTAWGKLYRSEFILNNHIKFVSTKEVLAEDLLFNVYAFANVKKAVYISKCFNHYRKENSESFTHRYKPDVVLRFKNLYAYLEEYINLNKCNDTFSIALNNRKCLNIIGCGLNVLNADKTINKRKEIKKVLNNICEKEVTKTLSLKYFPFHWKVFFFLVRARISYGVYLMLKAIKFLKNR